MNYPNIETCKMIAGEFPLSALVWVDLAETSKFGPDDELMLEWFEGTTLAIAFRCEVYRTIVAPAPTIEEMGEWLLNWERTYSSAQERFEKADRVRAIAYDSLGDVNCMATAIKSIKCAERAE